MIPNLLTKSLKNTCEEICILESYHTELVKNVIVRNAPLLKCLTSVSVNQLLETRNSVVVHLVYNEDTNPEIIKKLVKTHSKNDTQTIKDHSA